MKNILRVSYYKLKKIIFNDTNLFSGVETDKIDSKYALLKKSEFQKYQFIKGCYEDFFLKYPRKEKKSLKHNILHKFDDFIFELTLHEIFWNLNYCIGIHKGEFKGNTKPDFQLSKLFTKFHAEAKNVYDLTPEESARLKIEESIFNKINNFSNSYFYLKLWKLQAKTKKQSSAKHILSVIQKEIAKWPQNKLKSFVPQELKYENSDLIFRGYLELRGSNTWGNPRDTFVGTRSYNTIYGNTTESIKKAVKKKALKYGELNGPFVICLNILSSRGFDLSDIEDALYGQGVTELSFNDEPNKIFRNKNGIFSNSQRISGVLVSSIDSLSLFDSEYCYFVNPNAKYIQKLKGLKTAYLNMDKITVEYIHGLSFNELINKKYTPNIG